MFQWLKLLFDDPPVAEARLLRELLRESPEVSDWSAAVQPVLHRVLDGGPVKRALVCRVLEIPALNAFALPDRTVVVSQLLVEFCRDRADQMAFVLAHEAAHIHLGHARDRTVANTVLTAAPLANPLVGMGLRALFDRAYTREQEFEADEWAVRQCARAGYVPAAAMTLLSRLGHGEAPRDLVAALLNTHPPIGERMNAINAVILSSVRKTWGSLPNSNRQG
jgi:Zn-dependent protease with chaperone function